MQASFSEYPTQSILSTIIRLFEGIKGVNTKFAGDASLLKSRENSIKAQASLTAAIKKLPGKPTLNEMFNLVYLGFTTKIEAAKDNKMLSPSPLAAELDTLFKG